VVDGDGLGIGSAGTLDTQGRSPVEGGRTPDICPEAVLVSFLSLGRGVT
jgi:hypothetical protein